MMDQKAVEGQQATFECIIEGVPKPEITWLVGKKEIKVCSERLLMKLNFGVIYEAISTPKQISLRLIDFWIKLDHKNKRNW